MEQETDFLELENTYQELVSAHEMFLHSIFESQRETVEELYWSAQAVTDACENRFSVAALAHYRARLNAWIDVLVCENPATTIETRILEIAQEIYSLSHDIFFDIPGCGTASIRNT